MKHIQNLQKHMNAEFDKTLNYECPFHGTKIKGREHKVIKCCALIGIDNNESPSEKLHAQCDVPPCFT